MDAKPQRPMRMLRNPTDENLPPAITNGKAIHQRNKSSPALSTMLGGGGIKAAARRTAFGDVSNTANVHRPSKDDSTIPTKMGQPEVNRLGQPIQEKKSTNFLKPTQRPLSVSNLRNFLGSTTNSSSIDVTAKNGSIDNVLVNQNSNVKKVLTKRNTTIFKDPSLDTVQEVVPSPKKLVLAPVAEKTHGQSLEQLPPTSTSLALPAPPQQSEPVSDPIKELLPPSDTSLPGLGEVSLNPPAVSSEIDFQADLSVVDAPIERPTKSLPPELVEDVRPAVSMSSIQAHASTTYPPETFAMPAAKPQFQVNAIPPVVPHYSHPPTISEPEEYWDDEEDDGYEEEGYVTARSYRSKGDSTTGGVTTVLFPQMNQRARREISAAQKLVEATRTPEEIEDENYDTSMVAEYGDEIFDYMKQLEVKMLPNAHYMENQHEIQWSMRSVLMDWLVQVHHRFNLLPETLFLCVNYIDRFLSCKVVSLGKLQLVGATAIFIAAKYEEINCPSVQEIVYMVDGGYTIDEILKAERFMLTMLQFELGWPGPMSFLRRISKADDYDLETRTLAKYFLEVTVMDERFIGSPPSFTAAASHCLARMMLRKGDWSPYHVYYSNYTFSQLRPLLMLMLECCEDPRKHHAAVYNKYCDKRYKRASAFVEVEIQRGFILPGTPVLRDMQPPMLGYYDSSQYFRM